MVDIVHRIATQAPASKVYAALATIEGIAAWWTTETTGESKVGGRVNTTFHIPDGKELGKIPFEVVTLKPNQEVRWRFIDGGPPEWLGSEAIFTLSQAGDFTVINFAHRGWKEEVEFTAHCSTKWAIFLMSLKNLVETGKGHPAPDDVVISDWH